MSEIDVKKIRETLGVSQQKFAEMLGVHIRTVQNWEAGSKVPQSKLSTLRNIAGQDIDQTATNATAISTMAGGVVNNIATSGAEKIISPDGRTTIEPLYAEVIALREENKALKDKVSLLERIIAEKETIIGLLK